MEEGALRWAIWTFPCGLAALCSLGLAALAASDGRQVAGARLATLSAAALAAAAIVAGRHWRRLLEEREREREYAVSIALGLPVVTLAGMTGALVALLLASFLLVRHE